MSTLLHLGIAYVLVAGACALFVISLCVAAGRADDELEEARRREHDERKAENDIYGDIGGGWWSR